MSSTNPIMQSDTERYLAFNGLIQWTQGVIEQSKRIDFAFEQIRSAFDQLNHATRDTRPKAIKAINETGCKLHCEQHYFVIAVNKLLEYRDWIKEYDLFSEVDFSEIDAVNRKDLKDLRNMREHNIDYFKGNGHSQKRYLIQRPNGSADASSSCGNSIGGRLDYKEFTEIATRLLPQLLEAPLPEVSVE